jgi:hypothetical protein
MAEEPEVETDDLRDAIHELQEEREERHESDKWSAWTSYVALATAGLAVVAALAALQSGSLVNESLIAKQDATMWQARASDQWAYYQAKGVKGVVSSAVAEALGDLGKTSGAGHRLAAQAAHYASDQKKIMIVAREDEAKRDEENTRSVELLERHHIFAYTVTLTQVAIALSAIAALTRRKPIWFVSLGLGALGTILFLAGFVPHHAATGPPQPSPQAAVGSQ